jgi:hypothetical protein
MRHLRCCAGREAWTAGIPTRLPQCGSTRSRPSTLSHAGGAPGGADAGFSPAVDPGALRVTIRRTPRESRDLDASRSASSAVSVASLSAMDQSSSIKRVTRRLRGAPLSGGGQKARAAPEARRPASPGSSRFRGRCLGPRTTWPRVPPEGRPLASRDDTRWRPAATPRVTEPSRAVDPGRRSALRARVWCAVGAAHSRTSEPTRPASCFGSWSPRLS